MRVVSLVAVLALLALAWGCDAAISGRAVRHSAAAKQPVRAKADDRGRAYGLVAQLVASLHFKNYTWFASLLADDGFFMIMEKGCEPMNKTALVAAAKDEAMFSANQGILGEWIESDDGLTIIHSEVGAIFGNGGEVLYLPHVFYAAMATQDGTQLMMLERVSAKANPSPAEADTNQKLMNIWNRILASEAIGDIKVWEELNLNNFTFTWHAPWAVVPAVVMNASTFLAEEAAIYQQQTQNVIKVETAFPICNRIFASVMGFRTLQDGTASVQKLFIGIRARDTTDGLKLESVEEWAVGLI